MKSFITIDNTIEDDVIKYINKYANNIQKNSIIKQLVSCISLYDLDFINRNIK